MIDRYRRLRDRDDSQTAPTTASATTNCNTIAPFDHESDSAAAAHR
jgi:hypothetical protein